MFQLRQFSSRSKMSRQSRAALSRVWCWILALWPLILPSDPRSQRLWLGLEGGEREREENKSSSMRFVNQIFWRSSETKEASISSRRVNFLSNALGTCRLHHRAVWQTGSSFHRAWQSKPKITLDGSTDDDDDFTALDCRLYRQARLKRREMLA